MQIDVFTECLCPALIERLALNGLVVAVIVMGLHLCIAQLERAAQVLILALELHGEQLLLDLFLDADEPRLFALHRTLSSLLGKLVQADLMESLFALLALPGVD